MRNKGITLVALVITIIVLIILASVTFSIVLGQDGLIGKTKDGTEAYKKAAVNEQQQLENINDVIDSILSGNGSSNPVAQNPVVTLAEAQSDDMYDKTTNSTYKDTTRVTNNIVTIPAGYKMTDEASKIEDGIVIQDRTGNEWVWVPVDEPMADIIEPVELGNTGVTTSLKSKSELITGITRVSPGNTNGYKEPDLIKICTITNNIQRNIEYTGFSTKAELAADMSTSFKNMIESVEQYGGFYIGRYEITGTLDSPTEISGWSITGGSDTSIGQQYASWYKLYAACSKFTTTSATSRMIWGCNWDETCKFIANKGYTDANSNTYGNFKGVSVKASDGVTQIKGVDSITKLKTGITTFTRTCNIYDLAGNCWEWTQDLTGDEYRGYRGRRL